MTDTPPTAPPDALSQGWFTTWEVLPGVICIAENAHIEQVRSYLVRGSERWLLWDTGQGIADIRAEVERFMPVSADTLVVVMSHSHVDHVGGVAAFAQAGCEICAHSAEADRIAAGIAHEDAAYWLQEKFLLGPLPPGFDRDAFAIRGASVSHFLQHGEIIDLGDRQFAVIHTPGHSPGGIALWDAKNRVLLSGDTVYAGPLYAYSGDDADPTAYRVSTRALAGLAPHVQAVLPSHNATPQGPELLVAVADAFDAVAIHAAFAAFIAHDDEAGEDYPYDLYDYGAFQLRVPPGWGRGAFVTLAHPTNWRRTVAHPAALAALALTMGAIAGGATVVVGPVLPLAMAVGVAAVLAILRDARAGLFAAVAVVCLLPYATLPVRVGLTLTLLEAITLLTWGVLALRMAYDRTETVVPTPLYAPLGLFVAATAVAFFAGAGRGTTVTVAHDYFKLLLAVSLIALTVQLLHSAREVGLLASVLVAGGGVAGVIALVLQRLPVGTTTALLVRLRVVGYPTDRLVRYIEDNPELARRATGTGVDPNSFAGFLMLALVLAVGQATSRRPLVPRPVALVSVSPVALALLLTQSRAAVLGAAAGVLVLAAVRYRRLLLVLAVGAAVALVSGRGGSFAARLVEGFRGEDAATRLRFREFGNALALIREYPVFGVGFGDAPRIDLQTGVSSVYLTVASRVGLVGASLFLVLLGVLLWRLLGAAVRARAMGSERGAAAELLLAVAAALVAASVTATLDHYFFNLGFPHMVALFWLLAGMGEVLRRTLVMDT